MRRYTVEMLKPLIYRAWSLENSIWQLKFPNFKRHTNDDKIPYLSILIGVAPSYLFIALVEITIMIALFGFEVLTDKPGTSTLIICNYRYFVWGFSEWRLDYLGNCNSISKPSSSNCALHPHTQRRDVNSLICNFLTWRGGLPKHLSHSVRIILCGLSGARSS